VLPSPERLTRAGLFQRAYTARKSINTACFTLYVVPRSDRGKPASPRSNTRSTKTTLASPANSQELARIHVASMPLVGFVVAKKVCKSACARNRAKRRVREAYRLMRLSNAEFREKLSQWYAMVFVVHTKTLDAQWIDIQNAILECMNKANAKYGRGNTDRGPRTDNRDQAMRTAPEPTTSEGDLK
jgi:ribonuclease P protein component